MWAKINLNTHIHCNKEKRIQHRKQLKSGNFKYTLMYRLKGEKKEIQGHLNVNT